uniref:Splicing factor YJU2 n=1 Tax=Panagrellus redivivus TaxID=6233 RepID=A0A7E4VV16_PANRE
MTGTERKCFQKYYPPDFDPSKLPKANKGAKHQIVQRVMTPFRLQCNTCKTYIDKARKFNMRRETVKGETFLNLKLDRFYFRCPNCLADVSFKTDLECGDYEMEEGATKLYDAAQAYKEQMEKEAEDAETSDPMKQLEKRAEKSRQEMMDMDRLEEMMELNRRKQLIDPIECLLQSDQKLTEEQRQAAAEDANAARQMFYKPRQDGLIIRRIEDDDDELSQEGSLGLRIQDKAEVEKKLLHSFVSGSSPSKTVLSRESMKKLVVKKRRSSETTASVDPAPSSSTNPSDSVASKPTTTSLNSNTSPPKKPLLLLAEYNDDSD